MANPAIDRITGKYGYVVVSNSRDVDVNVYFTSWTAKIKRTFDDVTSTLCYNAINGLTYAAAVPVVASMTVDVAGRFRLCETSRGVVDLMFHSARRPFKAEIGFSPLDPYMQFLAYMEDLEVSTPAEGVVGFTCVMRSFGNIRNLTPIMCGEAPDPVLNYPGYPDSSPGPPSPGYPSPGTP